MSKISIIGAGNVGATTAQRLIEKDFGDIVLLDIIDGLAQGKALDIAHSAHVQGFNSHISGTIDYQHTAQSDIVIITSGASRKPGMTRDQLVDININIVRDVVLRVIEQSPDAILLVVTNPVDVMTYLAIKTSGLEPGKVLGLSGVLDGARLAYLISRELNVAVTDVETYVMGEHGQQMVVFPRLCTIRGIPFTKMLPQSVIQALVRQTVNSGAEVVNLLKSSSAYYAPSAAITKMAAAIMQDSHQIVTAAAYLNGQYGLKNIVVGAPVKLSRRGVESIVELELNPEEQRLLAESAAAINEIIMRTGI